MVLNLKGKKDVDNRKWGILDIGIFLLYNSSWGLFFLRGRYFRDCCFIIVLYFLICIFNPFPFELEI